MAKAGRPRLPDKVMSQMRIEVRLYAKIREIAKRESRSINAQVEYFAQQGVDRYERDHGPIEVTNETE